MPHDLLSLDAVRSAGDYYHTILEPIFFEVLNKKINSRKETYTVKPFSDIPYLNGGLFAPHDDDHYSYNDGKQAINHNLVVIPDSWFVSFFEILETYNFTIDENTSFDEELSIDPEMLGRIFENLLAEINPETGESARKSTGSYYTPRVIVDYMVDESLYLYLKDNTGIPEKKLRSVISYDLDDDSVNPLTDEERDKITQALQSVRILDPACGSGAFPIGALQKIVFILQRIDPHGQIWFNKQIQNTSIELRRLIQKEFEEKNFDYLRKLGVIRENIYGVDIQPIATEISRLRCFLTLVVDQRVDDTLPNRGIEPLPNLEFKFVTANTLIGLPKFSESNGKGQVSLIDSRENIDRLKSIIITYFNADIDEKKDLKFEFVNLQKQIYKDLEREYGWSGVAKADLTRKLTDWEPFSHKATDWFDSEWMFGVKDGFDIVIGNPPYVSAVTMARDDFQKKLYKKLYPLATGSYDLYLLFLLKAIELANITGTYTWIIPNKFLIADYAKKCKLLLIESEGLLNSLDVSKFKVFKETGVYPIIIIGKKSHHGNFKELMMESYEDLGRRKFKEVLALKKYKTFKEYGIKLNAGTTGFQAQQIVPFITTENSPDVIPFIVSGGVDRYYWSNENTRYMGNKYSRSYIGKNKYIAMTKWEFWNREKIIIAGMTKKIESVYSLNSIALGVGIYGIYDFAGFDPKCLNGLLNSKFMTNYFRKKFKDKHLAGGYLGINKSTIENLPLVNISNSDQEKISTIVDQILSITSNADYDPNNPPKEQKELETQIDKLTYELYGLTEKEIRIVEDNHRE